MLGSLVLNLMLLFGAQAQVAVSATPTSATVPLPAPALSQYIVIQNVATERTRVYERGSCIDCPHKMIFETEMVAGRAEGDRTDRDRFLTWLGHYKITGWKKFYQDAAGHYPSWYDPTYPAVPYKPTDPKIWFEKKMMPNGGPGVMRGAFGWYTAFVGPNSNEQWMHGTLGWGIEGDRYVKYTRGFWLNMFTNPRSSGCTRMENRAIAYLRDILPEGTEVLRVYAREAYRDAARATYAADVAPVPWKWILTKESVRQDGTTANWDSVVARAVPRDQMLEWGVYSVDRHPDAIPINHHHSERTGLSGNTYEIPETEFQGVFLIDEGRFVNYRHPNRLPHGGMVETDLPDYLRTQGNYTVPVATN